MNFVRTQITLPNAGIEPDTDLSFFVQLPMRLFPSDHVFTETVVPQELVSDQNAELVYGNSWVVDWLLLDHDEHGFYMSVWLTRAGG